MKGIDEIREKLIFELFAAEKDIEEVVLNPDYWRVQEVLLHCYNCQVFPTEIPTMLAGSDQCGRGAILAILTEYSINMERGWICPMARKVLDSRKKEKCS